MPFIDKCMIEVGHKEINVLQSFDKGSSSLYKLSLCKGLFGCKFIFPSWHLPLCPCECPLFTLHEACGIKINVLWNQSYSSQDVFSLFEQQQIWISIHQISIISVIVISQSESQLENLLPELCHLLRAVDQLGKLVTGEQVMGKPLDEIQMKILCKIWEMQIWKIQFWKINLRITLSRIFSISSSLDSAFLSASTGLQISKLSISLLNSRILSRVSSSTARSLPDSEHKPHLVATSQSSQKGKHSVVLYFCALVSCQQTIIVSNWKSTCTGNVCPPGSQLSSLAWINMSNAREHQKHKIPVLTNLNKTLKGGQKRCSSWQVSLAPPKSSGRTSPWQNVFSEFMNAHFLCNLFNKNKADFFIFWTSNLSPSSWSTQRAFGEQLEGGCQINWKQSTLFLQVPTCGWWGRSCHRRHKCRPLPRQGRSACSPGTSSSAPPASSCRGAGSPRWCWRRNWHSQSPSLQGQKDSLFSLSLLPTSWPAPQGCPRCQCCTRRAAAPRWQSPRRLRWFSSPLILALFHPQHPTLCRTTLSSPRPSCWP